MSLQTKDIAPLLKKSPLVTGCGLLVLILLVFSYFRMGSMDELQSVIDEKSRALRVLDQNVKNSAQLEVHINELRSLNALLRKGALREGDLVGNQQFFLRLEDELGIKITDYRSTPSSPAPGAAAGGAQAGTGSGPFVTLRFSLSASGSYTQLMNFTKGFEAHPTLCSVVNASYSEIEGELKSLNITVDVLGVRP